MSTNYWQTNSRSLGEIDLSNDQLPQMFVDEEGDLPAL